jgi:hypothetical protein
MDLPEGGELALPKHLRVVRGTRLAVDRAARVSWRLGPRGWAPVDLEQEPFVRRALPLLTARAWPLRPDHKLLPPGVPPGARPVPGAAGLWLTRRGVAYVYGRDATGVVYGHRARVRRVGGAKAVILGGRGLPLAELQRAAWGD